VEFLSDEEAAAYGRFVGVPSQTVLERWCFLDDADLRLVNRGGTQKFSVTPGYSVTLEQAFKSSRRVGPLSRGTELLRPDDDDGLSGALIPVGEGQLSPELSPLRGQGPSEFGKSLVGRSRLGESNPGPTHYERGALTLEHA